MSPLGIALAVVAAWTVVTFPVAVFIGRAIADADEQRRRALEAAQERHPSGRHLRSVAL